MRVPLERPLGSASTIGNLVVTPPFTSKRRCAPVPRCPMAPPVFPGPSMEEVAGSRGTASGKGSKEAKGFRNLYDDFAKPKPDRGESENEASRHDPYRLGGGPGGPCREPPAGAAEDGLEGERRAPARLSHGRGDRAHGQEALGRHQRPHLDPDVS